MEPPRNPILVMKALTLHIHSEESHSGSLRLQVAMFQVFHWIARAKASQRTALGRAHTLTLNTLKLEKLRCTLKGRTRRTLKP